jgi:hypothetical protein
MLGVGVMHAPPSSPPKHTFPRFVLRLFDPLYALYFSFTISFVSVLCFRPLQHSPSPYSFMFLFFYPYKVP